MFAVAPAGRSRTVRLAKARRPARKDALRLPSVFYNVARRYEAGMRRAFLEAVEQLQGSIDIEELTEALRDGTDITLFFEDIDPRFRQLGLFIEAAITTAVDGATTGLEEALLVNPRLARSWSEGPQWDVNNDDATAWARSRSANAIREISATQRNQVRYLIHGAFTNGRHPYQTARLIKDVVGLHSRQAIAVQNFQTRLEGQDLSPEIVQRRVSAYASRQRLFRARVIARTETLMSSNRGQEIVWARALRSGQINGEYTFREWIVARDERTCRICAPMRGERATVDGMWTLPNGRVVRTPTESHPQCRCTSGLVFDEPPDFSL